MIDSLHLVVFISYFCHNYLSHMNARTKKKLLHLMSEHLGVDRSDLTDDADLNEIMDDLDLIELIMAIEEEFNTELPDDIEKTVNGQINPFEQILMDGADGKLKGKSDEEIIELFKSASRQDSDVLNITVRQFLDYIEPHLPE